MQVPGKQIIYQGKSLTGKDIIVCSPQTKLHDKGYGWVDFTVVQYTLMNDFISIIAIRMEGDRVYYFNFDDLKPFLTKEAMVFNVREGDHWKLYIWPDYIQVLGNKAHFKSKYNSVEQLNLG